MSAQTPSERALIARIGAYSRWSTEPDPVAALAPARDAFRARFDNEVDPDRVLSDAERARRAQHAISAYYSRLALRSAQKRRKARGQATPPAETAAAASDGPAPGDDRAVAG